MKWIKIILLIATVPYFIWSLYDDFNAKQNYYLKGELKKLKNFGETYKKKVGKYAFRNCHFYRTYTLHKQMEGEGCVQNMTINSITYDTPTSSPRIVYRGKSYDGKYMCELSLGIIFEGKDAGEINCRMTRFKSSEAYQIPVGRAIIYARKLKDAENEKIRQEYLKKHGK